MSTKIAKAKGPTLLELADEWDAIFRVIESLDGEITPEVAAGLEALEFAEASKVDGYRFRRLAQDAEAEHLKAQAKALVERAKRIERAGERLDARLLAYMRQKGAEALAGHSYTARIQASAAPVEVLVPATELPRDYQRVKEPEPDKQALKLAIGALPTARPEDWPADTLMHDGKAIARLGEPTVFIRWT